jgi:hypothetical protein
MCPERAGISLVDAAYAGGRWIGACHYAQILAPSLDRPGFFVRVQMTPLFHRLQSFEYKHFSESFYSECG